MQLYLRCYRKIKENMEKTTTTAKKEKEKKKKQQLMQSIKIEENIEGT